MNTKNNARRRSSQTKIEQSFFALLQDKDLSEISVSKICEMAKLNRSTFYANYVDVYDLADTVRKTLEDNLNTMYQKDIDFGYNSNNYLQLFEHIKQNQAIYKTYFKLGYDHKYEIFKYDTNLAKEHFQNRFIDYHCEFFRNGISAIIKKWLNDNCELTPMEMNQILMDEYQGRE